MNYQFLDFPIEMMIEILKYKPFFRRINKLFYIQGEHQFKKLYGSLPIGKNEFIKYQTHFKGTVFTLDDYTLVASYLRLHHDGYAIGLYHEPKSISALFYCKSIHFYKNYPTGVYHRHELLKRD